MESKREFLDNEDEWFIDDEYIYVWAPKGINPSNATVSLAAQFWVVVVVAAVVAVVVVVVVFVVVVVVLVVFYAMKIVSPSVCWSVRLLCRYIGLRC